MKKGVLFGILAAVVIAIAAGGGYYLFFQNKVQSQIEVRLRQFFANPPAPFTKATYDKLDVALASRRITIDHIVLERSAPPYVIKIDRFEATGVDTDALESIFDPLRYKDGAPDQTMRKLADTVTLTSIDSDARDDGHTTMDQIVAKAVQAHQFTVKPESATIAAMSERERALMFLDVVHVDSVSINKLLGDDNKTSGVIGGIDVVDGSRQHIGAIGFDDLNIKNKKDGSQTSWKHLEVRDIPADLWFDFAISGKRPANVMQLINLGGIKIVDLKVVPGKPGDPTVHIASYDMGKVDSKRMERFILSGLEVSGGPGEGVTIGALEISNVNWENLLPLIGNPDWASRINQVSYSIDKFSLRDLGGASLDNAGAKLKEVSFAGAQDADSGKQTSTFTIDNFEIDAAKVKTPQAAAVLKALAYDHLNLSLEMVSSGDLKAGTVSMDKMRLFGPQVGELGLSFALSDYKQAPAKKPASIYDSLTPILASKLQSMKLSWKDDSLTPRLLKLAGAQQGMSAEQMRDALIMQIKAFSAPYQGSPPVAAAFQAVIDFLNKPGTLTVDAKPPVPPRFGELGPLFSSQQGPPNLPELFNVLGLTVTAQ